VGTVLASAWFVALALALGLRAGRRGLLLGLASGPIVGLFWIGFAAQENTVTREDRVVLIVALHPRFVPCCSSDRVRPMGTSGVPRYQSAHPASLTGEVRVGWATLRECSLVDTSPERHLPGV
jgi:hypothetical protein